MIQNGHHGVKLSKSVTIKDYLEFAKTEDRGSIARLLQSRFEERYIGPVMRSSPGHKSGFAMMAIACLTIEAFESFRSGWTKPKNEKAFKKYFLAQPEFGISGDEISAFYANIRCGILHDAETRGGWKILRKGPIVDTSARTINATGFLITLHASISAYCTELKASDWHGVKWSCIRKKFDSIIDRSKSEN